MVEKSDDSFCGSQELFWDGACASPGALPCRCCPGTFSHPGQVGARGTRHPQPPDPGGSQSREAAGGQGCCAIPLFTFQLGPYPFRPPAGFVMQRKLLKEPRQTDRKPSLSLLGHIVCPGLNLNIKRPYLFLLFINPEPCALKPRLGRVQERARGRAAGAVWTKVRLRCVGWDQGRLGCSVP